MTGENEIHIYIYISTVKACRLAKDFTKRLEVALKMLGLE